MNSVNTLLMMANVVLAGWYVNRKCRSRTGIELNHVMAFTWGFLFYWICPVALGVLRVFEDKPAMSAWYAIFDEVDDSKLAAYLLISLAAYLAFIFGTECGERNCPKPTLSQNIQPKNGDSLNLGLMNLYLLLAAVCFIAVSVTLRKELFTGYANIDAVEDLYSNRTMFSAVTSFTIALWILYTSMAQQKSQSSPRTSAIFANRFLVLYLAEAVLAVSMGSRYSVLSSVFMVATYCSVYLRKFAALTIAVSGAVALVCALAVGALRASGDAAQNITDIVFGGLTETLYGAFSLTFFLREYSFGILRWPAFLLSDYVYLVPRVLLPLKDSMILTPEEGGFHIENPVGGVHSFFSFTVNFGALGTVLFFFLFFYGIGFLKARRKSILARTTYSMISGWLLISFFRNPFEVSLVKDIFQMSFAVPAVVLASIYLASSGSRVSWAKPAPAA
jgi:hypothetical protein